ncbi:MAG: EAL domain-containing protein [Bdellovibrionales bacterium]
MDNILRNLAIGATSVCCAFIVALLSFISVELSVAVFTLGSLVYVITSEYKRRNAWEAAADFKFRLINKKHDTLSGTVKEKFEADERRERRGKNNSGSSPQQDRTDFQSHTSSSKNDQQEHTPISFHSLMVNAPVAANESYRSVLKTRSTHAGLPKNEITQPRIHNTSAIEDADSLSDLVVEELIEHSVKHQSVDVFIQPVLRLPQQSRRFYEVFARIRAKAGVYLPASRFMKLAGQRQKALSIDVQSLEKCIELVKNTQNISNPPSFFINIDEKTLKYGPFINKLLPFLAKNKHLAGRFIFEMPQSTFHDIGLPAMKIMRGLAQLGCAFSLDHVTDLNEDIKDLQRFRVRFLKIDANMLLNSASNEREYKGIMKAKRTLEGNGIGVIAEKVEDAKMMQKLIPYDLHYGQGYHFGRPDLDSTYESSTNNSRSKIASH